MLALADFIARHAIVILSGTAVLLLLLVTAFWKIVHGYGTQIWNHAVVLWTALSTSAVAARLNDIPFVGRFFTRTLTVVRYLGLYAVLAFATAIGALSVFFELVDEIGLDESLAQFDVALASALAQHLSREVLEVFALITHLGDRNFLIALVAIVAVGLLALERRVLAIAWVGTTAGGGLINLLLKRYFERPRPPYEHGLIEVTSWSFPSGHASGSMLVYSLLGYLIVRNTSRAWRIPTTVVMVVIIVFVGSSRVLLQVHYVSDVLAGYASAAMWSALCIAGLEAIRWREKG